MTFDRRFSARADTGFPEGVSLHPYGALANVPLATVATPHFKGVEVNVEATDALFWRSKNNFATL